MSLRTLTPAFVATISALSYGSACNPPRPAPPRPAPQVGNPPEPVPTAAPPTTASATSRTELAHSASALGTVSAAAKPKRYNPMDAKGRMVLRDYQGDGCHVYLNYPKFKPGERRLPGTAPLREAVSCPAIMLDEAYESCRGGLLQSRGDQCMCFQPGNPPRQFVLACPTSPP